MSDIHSCSYYCDRPGCIKAQRDSMRDAFNSIGGDPATVKELVEALRTLDSIERGMQGWHSDAKPKAWARARAVLAKLPNKEPS